MAFQDYFTQEACFQGHAKQELDSHGRETEGVCRQMDGYNPRPLCIGHNTGATAAIQSEAPSSETYLQVQGKNPKDSGKHDGLRD